jgi:low temperature requirement protein LtrA
VDLTSRIVYFVCFLGVVLTIPILLLYVVDIYKPIDKKIKQILNVVVIIAVVIWVLSLFVNLPHIHVGR